MVWKKGRIKFDDGSEYPAELLVKSNGQVWNAKIYKDNGVVEEVDVENFAKKLDKTVDEVYPYTYELDD
ncbi:hypothetical protein [Clostridium ganghwense]|uniref:Uncharacterized protein n=1 Tax=Clostridium ganghwense TaxID=312089 RepID=A0ABT4CUD9_9CLOT|nr:hypothetical protein [Clostridium ganghwense]MCY6371846.1 hypothetical protein [Clostridium ganghwense]